ncbi:TraB/GumN family protein [Bacteroides heparinolyticus]|uniref:TraB/GumN family protein n=1 Tax=Prevotella heparinolytica TaxID=28113 RepID=UPI0023F543D7|nr:TraB/GumN family protein [Bacteroides heparinolyticus]
MKKIISLLLLICLVQSAHAQLLWKISGNGLEKPSYVFGTYHLSPLGIKDSIAALPQAVNETTQVYGEVVMSEMMSPAFMQSMQQQMMMPKDSTLQSLFTPEQYEEVGKVIKENMMVDIAMLAQLKPAAITQQLAVILYMRHTPGFNPQEQLDNYFQQQAQQQGKKVGGLETVQSQIDILFNSQTLKRQAELLHCMAHDIDRTVGQVKRVIAAYEKQDLNVVLQLLAERHGDACDPLPGEMEALIDNRNKAWAEKMPAIMSEAPTLFVVGAGHLPGDNGLLNLLQQQSYTLEALK